MIKRCANRPVARWVILLAGLAMIAGCTPGTDQPATTGVKESEPGDGIAPAGAAAPVVTEQPQAMGSSTPSTADRQPAPKPEPEISPAEVHLAMSFKPGQVTTYHLLTGWQRQVVVRSLVRGQIDEVPSATTGNYLDMTYTQSVRQVDPNGRALLDIRIDVLKLTAEQVGLSVIQFDSSKAQDANQPLAKLIGRGYQIEMGPDGQVSRVLNLEDARTAVAGDQRSDQGKAAMGLLSEESIRDRHSVSALPAGDGVRKSGQSWNQVRTISFYTMGSRSFEKIYTFKGLEKTDGRSVAVIGMEGVLSSKGAEEAYARDSKAEAIARTFDMMFTYGGQCRLDLAQGRVERAEERLEVQWLAVDPKAGTSAAVAEPNSFVMRSAHFYRLEPAGQTAASESSAATSTPAPQGKEKLRFALGFQKGRTLEYKFSSTRNSQIQWDPNKAAAKPDPNNASDAIESLEMVVAYEPVKVDPNGLATIAATCKSVTAKRTELSGAPDTRPDAAEGLRGKAFTLTVDRTGRIRDADSLDALLKEIGKLPFREDSRQGRIKDPEMISDVAATQWFLWDAISSMDPEGEAVGQTWSSRLSLPTPMVMRKARDVTYSLDGVERTPTGRIATIRSQYRLSDQPAPASWPIPYSGRFRPSGPFGFLGGYKFLSFAGKGEERFDLDTGVSNGYEQEFQMELQAVVPMGLKVSPKIVIRQTIKMERVN